MFIENQQERDDFGRKLIILLGFFKKKDVQLQGLIMNILLLIREKQYNEFQRADSGFPRKRHVETTLVDLTFC